MKIIDEKEIEGLLARCREPGRTEFDRVLEKGMRKKGLSLEDAAVLLNAQDLKSVQKIFSSAAQIKQDIYGERLVLFAPLYISDFCVNNCAYCNFHTSNLGHPRRKLSIQEITEETKCLIDMGHKRVLVEFGEDPDHNDIGYICDAIRAVYSARTKGNIRRVNVNIAATTTENYRRLKECNIGTYQLFQETYHRSTYEVVHKGPKADYDRQITAHERAFEAGLDDLGIGVLFGLYDWRFEVLALISHARYMEKTFGAGPHTISVPRFQRAPTVTYESRHLVNDDDFLRLIAILRIAVPYTGMILTTRESPELRSRAFKIGISQASAASVTTPGGYSSLKRPTTNDGQFITQDHRPVDEFIKSIIADDLIPSFCTACYRKGRTGDKFMELAKPGEIHNFCRPNALLTFAEYLEGYGDRELCEKGHALIERYLSEISDLNIREQTKKHLAEIKQGKRDIYF